MLEVLKRVHWLHTKRTTGLQSVDVKIFGYMPRETIRSDYCRSTALSAEDPKGHELIVSLASKLAKLYKKYCPDIFDYHEKETYSKIKKDWILKDSPFTSGVINHNNPLRYHVDSGNIKKVFSNMICFKKDCTGGHLAVPEFNLGLEIADKTALFFDGQSILHGVTPFKLKSLHAYRYTLVYYTLQQMWRCEDPVTEMERIKKRKTARETERYKRLIGEAEIPALTKNVKQRHDTR